MKGLEVLMRFMGPVTFAVFTLAPALHGQGPLTARDSALVGRILHAEDRRDSTDAALAEGASHADPRVQTIARRAVGRIRDPGFAERTALPPLRAPPAWPEPAWRPRYRALTGRESDCALIRSSLTDSVWPVRLRAADLVAPPCGSDPAIVGTLREWVARMPRDASRRPRDGISWHGGAHGLVALARLRPAEAQPFMAKASRHPRWEVRTYVAKAASVLRDTTLLRRLARDRDDNVKDAAITELAKLAGHGADASYIAALEARGAQAVRSAALALKGSSHTSARTALLRALERWRARRSDTERDVRVAILDALGRPASEDAGPLAPAPLPPRIVALALGQDVRLRVTMGKANGGGVFIIRLRGDIAPIMAARVLALADSGYYDGLTWQRVEHDFVIQGGSPGANEYVGYPRYFRDEVGNVSHVRGTLGMSTRGHDTGDAQWFFNLKDNVRLDRDFTVFAEVVEGMDAVDRIMEGDAIARIREVRASGAK